jgi:hypothetical protein
LSTVTLSFPLFTFTFTSLVNVCPVALLLLPLEDTEASGPTEATISLPDAFGGKEGAGKALSTAETVETAFLSAIVGRESSKKGAAVAGVPVVGFPLELFVATMGFVDEPFWDGFSLFVNFEVSMVYG